MRALNTDNFKTDVLSAFPAVSGVYGILVFLNESLSMEMQVNQLCKVLYFQLRRISKIRSFLTVNAANTLAVASVPS